MAIISGRGGAPGTFIYEGAIASQAGRASFNTVYMLVDAPDESSTVVFPYNRAIAINSLNEYENLIGTLPTLGGSELTSYYAVKAFFQNAPQADLRVTRVGTPGVIQELAFSPAANKDNGVAIPSALVAGDVVYAKLTVNGKELGDRSPNGAWLGVPVTMPETYIAGDTDNNLAISKAMRDAVAQAIKEDADISAGAYIRETGEGDPACDECAYLYLTGRVFNSQVEIIESAVPNGNQFVFALSAYTVENVTASDQSVFDWIQCVNTAFEDAKLPQGYLCAPAAFQIYKQTDRVNLGQSMEEICSDQNHKWMAVVDCGPFLVTDIEAYSSFQDHSPADGFSADGGLNSDGQYLINNVIYDWTDSDALAFTSARYNEISEFESANPNLANGDQRALKDDRFRYVQTVADLTDNFVTMTSNWPSTITSGERVTVSVTNLVSDPQPSAPTYNDTFTSAVNTDLVGTFYVIASDVDDTLNANQIKLATNRTRALGNLPVDIVTAGTPQGGALLDIQYTNAAWEFEVEIKGKTSNLVEVSNNEGASFNTLHLPGSLQKPTDQYDFKSEVRQFTDPSLSIFRGGTTLRYFLSSLITTATDSITLQDHTLTTGDSVYLWQLPSATIAGGLTSGLEVYAVVVDANTVQFATSYANAIAGTVITISDTGTDSTTILTPLGAPAQAILTTGGDALLFSADHPFQTGHRVMFDNDIVYTNTSGTVNLFEGTDTEAKSEYFVKKDDRNVIRLTPSSSNLAAGVYLNFPVPRSLNTTVTAADAPAGTSITITGHGLVVGDPLTFTTSAGATLDSTLTSGTEVFVESVVDVNTITIAATVGAAAETFIGDGADGTDGTMAVVTSGTMVTSITTNTRVRAYSRVMTAFDGSEFSDTALIRMLRGRKYQLDTTLAVKAISDEANVVISAGANDPYGVAYTTDLSVDLRLSRSQTPSGSVVYSLAAPVAGPSSITITNHGYVLGQLLNVEQAASATLDSAINEGITYFAVIVDANTIQLAASAADAVSGTVISFVGDGVDNVSGISYAITSASNPYDYSYTEDEDSYPLNDVRDFAGDNNFYVVPLSSGIQENPAFTQVYIHLAIEEDTAHTTLFGAYTESEFVESNATVTNSLWNFDAITSEDLIGEALRGVNNNGTPQAVTVEKGMDTHTRLFEESQKYSTTQGFLAYYAPYILNDVGVYIPPTPFVTGLAMRRYRDEVAGFRLPPAGAKYSLAGARGVQVEITSGQQDVSNPYGLNALRQLPGYSETDPDTGITYGPVFVWGSRTRINPANAEQALYKFVNTRVIINVIYGTMRYAFDNQIFNVIDGRAVTFNQIRTIASNTLYGQFFVPGALFGATANEAFDVIVDDRNNPAGNLENGLVNVQIFVVPVPTLERIEIDLLRVGIGQIQEVQSQLGFLPAQNY